MKTKLAGCFFVALLLGITGYALAQPADGPSPQMVFERLDTDQDGVISPEEFEQGARQRQGHRRGAPDMNKRGERLQKADSNDDGVVSKDEFEAAFPKAPENRFMQLDTNKDGVLTKADRPRAPQAMQGRKGRNNRQGPPSQKANRGPGRGRQMPPPPCSPKERFEACDVNQDGVLTLEEFQNAPRRKPLPPEARRERMRAADKDGDKRISFEEAQAAFPKLDRERFDQRDKNDDGFWDREDRGPRQNREPVE